MSGSSEESTPTGATQRFSKTLLSVCKLIIIHRILLLNYDFQYLGAEAKKVFDEGNAMLQEIIASGSLEARAIVGFYPAHSSGDDILLFKDEGDSNPAARLFGLRQQADSAQEDYSCISDFVAPADSGKADYVGMFAVSCGFGCSEMCKA